MSEFAKPHIDWLERQRFAERAVRRYLGQSARNEDDVREVAQIVLTQLYERTEEYDDFDLDKLTNTIASARAKDFIRKRMTWSKLIEPMGDGDDNLRSASVEQEENAIGDPVACAYAVILQWWEQNSPECRKLWLKKQERTLKLIAAELGVQHAALLQRWSRCLKRVRLAMHSSPSLSILKEVIEI